ncbi:hypothetical protein HYE67_006228 [Fusarium culmorum]|uniref:Mannan endo-1,6-alpha-mannosidase n=1 Tax=Fusarium culmorum TaxID=5516 RepID=A0A2T4GER8_FUSCU|nr:hypothetical protein FCULG_00009979 [Fusarium culmorum]QPC63997.1 hypothetical protein HYE67_006228 [Fusarium culmorum]
MYINWAGLFTRGSTVASSAFVSSVRPEARSVSTYTEKAVTAIQVMNEEFYNAATGTWDNAWWSSANVVTTLSDFVTLELEEANKLNIGGILATTYTNAQKTTVHTMKTMTDGVVSSSYCLDSDSGCMMKRSFLGKRGFDNFLNEFYDDEGWWALAWIRASDATGDQQYLEAAIDIFNDMQTGTGTKCGGIRWKKEGEEGSGYVNAIANELYLMTAASLARRVPNNGTYLEIAKKQWNWFQDSGMINKDGLINDGLTDDCKNNGLQTWSYNQGVVLGGLVELALATGDDNYTKKAHKIANAAIKHLSNSDGILIEADDCEHKDGHCGVDGQQFKGIFVRNLRYLHTISPKALYRRFITKNAISIWRNDRDDKNLLGVAWAGPYVRATGPSHSSALDAIVAAIAVS